MNKKNEERPARNSKAAKARKMGTQIHYRVNLLGRTWGGFDGAYTYTFDEPPTAANIRSKAGDFESITDYSVTAIIRTQLTDGYQIRHKIVEPWKREESDLQFFAATEEN